MPRLAQRDFRGKPQWNLIPLDCLESTVRAMMHGAAKYAPDDWMKGQKFSTIFNSTMRHLVELQAGNNLDKESGLPIIGHLGANIVIMSWMLKHRPDLDDRRKYNEKNSGTSRARRVPHRGKRQQPDQHKH